MVQVAAVVPVAHPAARPAQRGHLPAQRRGVPAQITESNCKKIPMTFIGFVTCYVLGDKLNCIVGFVNCF